MVKKKHLNGCEVGRRARGGRWMNSGMGERGVRGGGDGYFLFTTPIESCKVATR